jgi:hypothetical protein
MIPDCLCGDPWSRHGQGLAGPHTGACHALLCGCLWYRPRPDGTAKPAETERAA